MFEAYHLNDYENWIYDLSLRNLLSKITKANITLSKLFCQSDDHELCHIIKLKEVYHGEMDSCEVHSGDVQIGEMQFGEVYRDEIDVGEMYRGVSLLPVAGL